MNNRLPLLRRRCVLCAVLAAAVLPALGGTRTAPITARLATTPEDDIGPFYPLDWSGEIDADLAQFGEVRAEGQPLLIAGYLKDATGLPLREAVVEIWQADARGRYRHPGVPEQLRDPGFQGYGRYYSDDDGGYVFQTVMPGRYGTRPPHVHFRVALPGRPDFVTQMYFRGNNRDAGMSPHDMPPERLALSVPLRADASGRLNVRFDLVLPA